MTKASTTATMGLRSEDSAMLERITPSGVTPQPGEKFIDGQGVQNVCRRKPGAAQLHAAELHLIELVGGVRVGVDGDFATQFFRAAQVQVRQVGPCRRGVVLDGDAKAGGSGE